MAMVFHNGLQVQEKQDCMICAKKQKCPLGIWTHRLFTQLKN